MTNFICFFWLFSVFPQNITVNFPTIYLSAEDFGCGYGNELGGFDHDKQPLCSDKNGQMVESSTKENKAIRKGRSAEKSTYRAKLLSGNTISQYFYMPITRASRELKVGLTLLKNRSR